MHPRLGTALPSLCLVLLLGLAGCGDQEADSAADEASSSTPSTASPTAGPSEDPTKHSTGDAVDFELVGIFTETGAGGAVSEIAAALEDDAAVGDFVAQFETEPMREQVRDAVATAEVTDGRRLYGAVVSIGCDAPTEVAVTRGEAGIVVTAQKVADPQQECFAAMTTVALVVAPAG